LITRFNAWAQLRDCAEDTVEKIVVKQTALLTAWRIERFAGGLGGSGGVHQEQTAAFKRIPPDDAMHNDWAKTAWQQAQAHEQAQDELATVINRPGSTMRDVQKAQDKVAANPAPPGVVDPRSGQVVPGLTVPSPAKDFDPSMDHSQLREAALEFREDYLHWRRVDHLFNEKGKRLPSPLAEPGQASLIDSDPDWKRPWHLTWTLIGLWLATLFSRPINPDHEYEGVYLLREGEQRWRDVGNGQGLAAAANRDLLALFDEHIHDSRAWFMMAATGNREIDASYFRLRTILYDDLTNKRYLNALQKSAAACAPPAAVQAQPTEWAGQEGGG
uniref:T6SS phospholipase effector Tle1-like catalytic domain-containing protein n=1 Tax=Aquitalea sp. ASV15 TaxID=2795104 RepID=UPI0018EC17C8